MRTAGGGMSSLQACGVFDEALEAEDAEVSPAGGEVGFGYFCYAGERHDFDYTFRCSWSIGFAMGWVRCRRIADCACAGVK